MPIIIRIEKYYQLFILEEEGKLVLYYLAYVGEK